MGRIVLVGWAITVGCGLLEPVVHAATGSLWITLIPFCAGIGAQAVTLGLFLRKPVHESIWPASMLGLGATWTLKVGLSDWQLPPWAWWGVMVLAALTTFVSMWACVIAESSAQLMQESVALQANLKCIENKRKGQRKEHIFTLVCWFILFCVMTGGELAMHRRSPESYEALMKELRAPWKR